MGLVYADVELARWYDVELHRKGLLSKNRIHRTKVRALVDSGATMMAINENVRKKLKLEKTGQDVAVMANETRLYVDIVGPIAIKFKNRHANVDAMVLPGNSQVLLGAIPMEYMDVLVDPKKQELIVNPEHPIIPVLRI